MSRTKRKQPEPVIIPAHPGFALLSYDGQSDQIYEHHVVAWAVWPGTKKERLDPDGTWGFPQPVCFISPGDPGASGLRYPDGSVLSLVDTGRVFRDTGEYLARQKISFAHELEEFSAEAEAA